MKCSSFKEKIAFDEALTGFPEAGAIYSLSYNLRYVLWRKWDYTKPRMAVIGLNPSTATHLKSDPTITREVNFAKEWGYGSLFKLNAFAYRATKPEDMKRALQPVGWKNDAWILHVCSTSDLVIVAWGNHGEFDGRCHHVMRLLQKAKIKLHCLGTNANGSPKHPLYLPANSKPIRYPVK